MNAREHVRFISSGFSRDSFLLVVVVVVVVVVVAVQITAEGEPDEAVERVSSDSIKLYQVSDESGTMTTEEVLPSNGGGLTADLLNVRSFKAVVVPRVKPFLFVDSSVHI